MAADNAHASASPAPAIPTYLPITRYLSTRDQRRTMNTYFFSEITSFYSVSYVVALIVKFITDYDILLIKKLLTETPIRFGSAILVNAGLYEVEVTALLHIDSY